MPFEYIQSFLIALCPPVWFYIMNPRVKSIRDAQEGISNPDAWNNEHSLSKADRYRNNVGMGYLALISLGFTLLLFVR